MNTSLENFILEELKREKRGLMLTWVIGIGFSCFLTLYMWQFIAIPVDKVVLNPYNLSSFIASYIDKRVAPTLSSVESQLKELAPSLADESSQRIQTLLPAISEYGIAHVDNIVSVIDELDKVTYLAIGEFFETYDSEIKNYVNKYGRERFVERFVDELTLMLISEIETSLGLDQDFSTVSVGVLTQVESEISDLSRKTPFNMTPADRLKRRLIIAWTGMFSDLSGVEKIGQLGQTFNMGMAKADFEKLK